MTISGGGGGVVDGGGHEQVTRSDAFWVVVFCGVNEHCLSRRLSSVNAADEEPQISVD